MAAGTTAAAAGTAAATGQRERTDVSLGDLEVAAKAKHRELPADLYRPTCRAGDDLFLVVTPEKFIEGLTAVIADEFVDGHG